MALSTGNKALWSDIRALYDRTNAQRKRWGYSTATISKPGTIQASTMNDLKSKIQAMTGTSFLSSAASTADVSSAAVGSKISASIPTGLSSVLSKVESTCGFCGGFNTSGYATGNSGTFGAGSCSFIFSCSGFNATFGFNETFFGSSFYNGYWTGSTCELFYSAFAWQCSTFYSFQFNSPFGFTSSCKFCGTFGFNSFGFNVSGYCATGAASGCSSGFSFNNGFNFNQNAYNASAYFTTYYECTGYIWGDCSFNASFWFNNSFGFNSFSFNDTYFSSFNLAGFCSSGFNAASFFNSI